VLNGCVCCTVRSDLIDILHKLADRVEAGDLHLDGIVIETTGMADPSPVAQTFLVDEKIREFARLDGVVTMVDAKHIEQHLDEVKPEGVVNEAASQIAFADRLLLNKTDLVEESDLERIEARLRGVNQFAPIQRCSHSEVSVESVLNIHGFNLERALKSVPTLLDANAAPTKHDKSVTSVSLDQGAPRHLRLVAKGKLDYGLVRAWLNEVINTVGEDMFRMKGILNIEHAEAKWEYHAVHMLFSAKFAQPWGADEPSDSKMVFIGKGLDAKALAARFNACLATPENLKKKADDLRFGVGDAVECCVGRGLWVRGKIIGQLYRNERMQQGFVAPYQVLLDEERMPGDDRLIFAPMDDDRVIRVPCEEV
jgi:G3E family GTPase